MTTPRLSDYLTILLTIGLTVYGQLILKWRMGQYGNLPLAFGEKVVVLLRLVFDPYIFSGFVAAFLASLAWMAAMTRFELSYAYPFMSLNFAVVLLLSAWLLAEPMSWARTIGVSLIVVGTVIAARG